MVDDDHVRHGHRLNLARVPGGLRDDGGVRTTVGLEDFVAEEAMLLGAGSTVLYQLALRGVGLGVAEHTTTLDRPFDRLRTTLTFVYVMVLGTEEERRAIARMVNNAHAPVRSPGRYSAFDPDLQLWVAATLAHNGAWVYEKVFGPLDAESRERIHREAQVFGTCLQVPPDAWPASYGDFAAYWEKMLDGLEPDPAVQEFARRLLSTSEATWATKPLLPLQSLMARGNLDPRAREVLGLPWTRRDEVLHRWFWRLFPPVYRRLPRRLRRAHAHAVLAGMRRRLRSGRRVI